MRADKAAVSHVDELRLDRRHSRASGDRKRRGSQWWPITRCVQCISLANCGPQQFVIVEHDRVGGAQIAHLLRFERRLRDIRHRHVQEPVLDERKHIGHASRLRCLRPAQSTFFESARTGDQTDADFDQADIALKRRDRFRTMQDQFATAAECHAADRSNGRYLRVLEPHKRILHFLLFSADRLGSARHEDRHHRLQIGADRKRIVGRPDDQTAIL